jgi:hypothetical protein
MNKLMTPAATKDAAAKRAIAVTVVKSKDNTMNANISQAMPVRRNSHYAPAAPRTSDTSPPRSGTSALDARVATAGLLRRSRVSRITTNALWNRSRR